MNAKRRSLLLIEEIDTLAAKATSDNDLLSKRRQRKQKKKYRTDAGLIDWIIDGFKSINRVACRDLEREILVDRQRQMKQTGSVFP